MSLTVSVSDIVNQSTSELLGKHESWERVELDSIAKVLNGFAFNSANFSKERGIPLIRIRDISRNFTETQYDGPYDETYLIKPDDLLVGMDGDFNCALWRGPAGLLNQRVCKIEVYQEFFSKKFLFYALPGYLKAINDVTSSMTVKHLSSNSIGEVPLPLPPLPEQHRIVAAIEQQFTRLDNAVSSLQSAKARVKQYRASLLRAAVEGELSKEWRAAHQVEETGAQLLARILAERRVRWEEEQLAKMREKPKDDKWRQAYKDPQGPDVKQLLMLPEGWCWATVEQIGDATEQVVLTGPFGSTLGRVDFRNEGIPLLTIGCLTEQGLSLEKAFYISEGKAAELERYKVKVDDILFSRMASVGRADLVPKELEGAVINYHLMRLRLSNTAIKPYYFISFIRGAKTVTDYIREVNHGVTRDGINTNQLLNLPIAIPPLAEQEQIVAEVETRLSNIVQLEETIEASLKRAEHERQSILREAFAGRLVPQDPDDEPASVLLERIREERKKREEMENIARVNRKGIQMESTKRRRAGNTSLYTALVKAGHPIPPDELFKGMGLETDEQPESVEVFYEELHADVENALVAETWPDYEHVLLEALEPSAEVLGRIAEEEAARQAQEAEQGGKTIDAPMLWNMEPPREPRIGGM